MAAVFSDEYAENSRDNHHARADEQEDVSAAKPFVHAARLGLDGIVVCGARRATASLADSTPDGCSRDERTKQSRTNVRHTMPQPLVERAREVLENAYVPYSEYTVGAALRTADGTVYVGCNIENANYSNSLHAEEVAIAEAVKNGHTEFDRVVVTSGARDGVTPCGMCRQTLAEFADEDLEIVCDLGGDDVAEYTLGELLPNTISLDTLEAAAEKRARDE
ncbi:cytidine deaminase [Haloferax sp. DFSO52]|uniref:cytidine deaminase n=1 Tax=Haloferax sp. DFSO52 TaxID=3388505 RepID=UPI003A881C20